MKKIEHVGFAVKDIGAANRTYEKILGVPPYKSETVEGEGVVTSFFKCGESKIELLQALHGESPIAKFIEKRGEGVHHIAFAVDDIKNEIKRLQKAGFTVLNETPKRGADNKWVAFVHPKAAHGVLVELCQEMGG
ncbi:MAG: methylmalonyl-CoA epimerase [Marinirhabdus sp.]